MRETHTCVDCGHNCANMTARTLAKGSSVRDPGEAVCPSCQSARVIMLRQVDRLPPSLHQIRAQRMVRA